MSGRTSLIKRLLAEECEMCGKKNQAIEMHHIRKLKDLKGKKMWEQMMISRKENHGIMPTMSHRFTFR